MVCFAAPLLIANTMSLLTAIKTGEVRKNLGTKPSHWELIFSEFSDVFILLSLPLKELSNKKMTKDQFDQEIPI